MQFVNLAPWFRRRLAVGALACMLLAQWIGLLHGFVHVQRHVHDAVHAHGHAPEHATDELRGHDHAHDRDHDRDHDHSHGHGRSVGSSSLAAAFSAHEEGDATCALLDQVAEVAASLDIIPWVLAPTAAALALRSGEAIYRWHACAQARGPPLHP